VDPDQTSSNKTEFHHATYHDEGVDEFRDFVNFIDGVGLSAQWTPEYDFDWMRFNDQHQLSRRHTPEPNGAPSPAAEDIGTPFSTWLPSAPADDQVRLVSDIGDGQSNIHLLVFTAANQLQQMCASVEPKTEHAMLQTNTGTS